MAIEARQANGRYPAPSEAAANCPMSTRRRHQPAEPGIRAFPTPVRSPHHLVRMSLHTLAHPQTSLCCNKRRAAAVDAAWTLISHYAQLRNDSRQIVAYIAKL